MAEHNVISFLLILLAVLTSAFLIFAFRAFDNEDYTCSSYGEVSVAIDNDNIICVPWEKIADFDQFRIEE